jgi:ribulose bisphosphate carboxylase small subunit
MLGLKIKEEKAERSEAKSAKIRSAGIDNRKKDRVAVAVVVNKTSL